MGPQRTRQTYLRHNCGKRKQITVHSSIHIGQLQNFAYVVNFGYRFKHVPFDFLGDEQNTDPKSMDYPDGLLDLD